MDQTLAVPVELGDIHKAIVVGDKIILSGIIMQRSLTRWEDIARAIGVPARTLRERRAAHGDRTRPFFASAEAAIDWYQKVNGGPLAAEVAASKLADAAAKRKPRKAKASKAKASDEKTAGAIDWAKVRL